MIRILNPDGALINELNLQTGGFLTIHLNVPKGLYLIQLFDNWRFYTKKWVVN